MTPSDRINSWERIRQGVSDAETLISQKKYNLSMVKSRQTLEYMVSCLCEQAGISETDLATAIDSLYNEQCISKTTCEHYHKIRMLGNKAVHEGNDNAYDANQAYHLLSQEVYTFSNSYRGKSSGPSVIRQQNQSRQSAPRATARAAGAAADARSGKGRSSSSGSGSTRSRRQQEGFSITSTGILRLAVIVLCIIFLVVLIRFLSPGKEEEIPETTVVTSEAEEETVPETEAPTQPETMAETTPAPVYRTTTTLNVRSEPSTDASKLGLIAPDTIVDFVDDYDDEWAIIDFEGTQAYVSKQYLVHD